MWNYFARMFPMVSDTKHFAALDRAASSQRRRGPTGSPSPEPEPETTKNNEPRQFYPSLFDVLKVRYLLQWKVTEAIPPEIVDLIIDAAEYWPSRETSLGDGTVIRTDMDRELLRTGPLCTETTPTGSRLLPHRTAHPCRKIVFSIASHDQGWGGGQKGSYGSSNTWFDAEILPSTQQEWPENELAATHSTSPPQKRSFSPGDVHLLSTENKLQCNKTAEKETQRYTITWHHLDNIDPTTPEAEEMERTQGRGRATLDGRRVRQIGLGDSISVIGRARFGGWTNHIDQLSVRIFWAV